MHLLLDAISQSLSEHEPCNAMSYDFTDSAQSVRTFITLCLDRSREKKCSDFCTWLLFALCTGACGNVCQLRELLYRGRGYSLKTVPRRGMLVYLIFFLASLGALSANLNGCPGSCGGESVGYCLRRGECQGAGLSTLCLHQEGVLSVASTNTNPKTKAQIKAS